MTEKIKVGIIGFGKAGEGIHLELIRKMPNFTCTAIMSSKPAVEINAKYPKIKVFSNINTFLEESDIELVIIATPNNLHYSNAQMSLKAGKHVVIDKPFAVTHKDGLKLLELATAKNLVLSIFHNKRWSNDFVFLQHLIKENKLGCINELHLYWDCYCPEIESNNWRETDIISGGRLYDLGSHLIDQVLTLFGLPDEIAAKTAKTRINAQTVDNFDLVFSYNRSNTQSKTLKIYLGCSYDNPILRPKLIAIGDKAIFSTEGLDVRELLLQKSATTKIKIKVTSNQAIFVNKITGSIEHFTLPESTYENYYSNIYNVIKNNAPLAVTAEQALNVIKIIEEINADNVL